MKNLLGINITEKENQEMPIDRFSIKSASSALVDEKNQYLDNYENRIEVVIKKLRDDTLPASKGGLIGTMREISEYDSLATIKALYDAASDVDLFYSKECQKW